MKKKQNAQQRRDAQKAMLQNKAAAKKQAAEKAEDEKAAEKDELKAAEEEPQPKAQQKSRVKAAGVKSTFAVDSSVVMTSFGKGNAAVIEKRIENNIVEDINDPAGFDVKSIEKDGKKINVKGRHTPFEAAAEKPPCGMDALRLKDVLEKKYFGRTFPGDNIHIQLIYNILDIEKILAVYSSNIVFSLDNMIGDERHENSDFIGYLGAERTYDEYGTGKYAYNSDGTLKREILNEYFANPRIRYFGDVFNYVKNDGKTNKGLENKRKHNYDVLALMGSLRQACFHGKENAWLYKLDKGVLQPEFKKVLNDFYSRAIEPLNKNFVKQNKVNLIILDDILPCLGIEFTAEELVKNYYTYIVSKDYKNIGFSIKRLREDALSLTGAEYIKAKEYDSIRHKLYKITDFVIYSYYLHNAGGGDIDKNVAELRAMLTEEEKESFYARESERIWKDVLKDTADYVMPLLKEENIKKLQKQEVPENMVLKSEDMISAAGTSYFCKLIYLVTRFLDGKEINDLLTTLINKFDNIHSFTETLNKLSMPAKFTDDYAFFEGSAQICADLKNINSFARMQKADENAKKQMYKDAFYILGVSSDYTGENLDKKLDEIADKALGYINGEKIKGASTGFRNFIASNVIESSRFKYIVRYGNAKKVKAAANNRSVISFAFKQLPDTQIERYYESCGGTGALDRTGREKYLLDLFAKIDYKMFENVKQNTNARGTTKADKENKAKMQAVIGLYLTILYHITKNLVYVNSRYVIALHCLERDMRLYKIKDRYNKYSLDGTNCFDLTNLFIEKGYLNKRAAQYIKKDMGFITGDTFIFCRNVIAHLSVIRNFNAYTDGIGKFDSYFQLYHFVLQSIIKNGTNENNPAYPLLEAAEEHKSYSKDFVKAMNTPFGYSLPRFKNLSIDDLFDKNKPAEK